MMTTLVTLAMGLAAATTAAAQERPLFQVAPLVSAPVQQQPLFAATSLAAQAAATPAPSAHQFGVGVRLGGFTFGIGGSVRYFFDGGPLGIQFEIARYGLDYGAFGDFSSTRSSPAVIYRFREIVFEAPITLTPYAGGGISIIRSSFDDDFDVEDFCLEDDELCEEIFEDIEDETDDSRTNTSTGVLLFGGVELFFEKVPKLGVSGELTFNSNDDIGTASLGGPAFTVAGHWYFK